MGPGRPSAGGSIVFARAYSEAKSVAVPESPGAAFHSSMIAPHSSMTSETLAAYRSFGSGPQPASTTMKSVNNMTNDKILRLTESA